MASTWSGLNLLIVMSVALGAAGSALAEAGYGDAISARTQKNTGLSGQWYELKTSDWVFYEGEAAAQYNLGAIAAGTKVEVLKMNKQMARVRLPDGRVVFIRNRLLGKTTAPSAAEKQTQAARTADIGKTKLHGGSPHAKPAATDFAVANLGSERRAEEERPAAVPAGTLAADTREVTPPAAAADIPLPATDGSAVVTENAPRDTQRDDAGTVTAPAATPAETAALPENVPVPVPRPADLGAAGDAAAAPANGKCDPKKQWQSPVHQTYRITDCLGTERDGGGRRHAGIDIAGASPGMQGIPIYPAATGRVIRAGHNGGYGCFVEIAHKTCPDSIVKWRREQGCVTRYAHLATKTYKDRKGKTRRTCDVPNVGADVTPCTRIGGMSGTGARGRSNDYAVHLHFELRDNSTSVAYNPNTLIGSLRRDPNFKSQGSASCKGTNDVHAADVGRLNNGRIAPLANVRAEGRD